MGFLHREELEVRMNHVFRYSLPTQDRPDAIFKRRERIAGIPNTLPLQDFTGVLSLAASDYFCAGAPPNGNGLSPGTRDTKRDFITSAR
jgi:hypothetical protein